MYEDVLNLKFYKGEDRYSDGDIEDRLLELCESGQDLDEILRKEQDWPILYHLSDIRENVLDWYGFDPQGTLLEIGAGCGAVTGLFCRKTARVTAIDLSKRRSAINAARNGRYGNLEIFVGNFEDIRIENTFDYVTLIGVLEYAGYYISGDAPYAEMLKRVKSFLKPGGKLIIAIENKYGLKYWAGAPEDHTGGLFDGIEGYGNVKGIQTFSRPELIRLLSEAGFEEPEFYYPMPDYKLPDTIYSDRFLPKPGMLGGAAAAYDRDRCQMFREAAAWEGLIKDGQFPYFANSFWFLHPDAEQLCGRKDMRQIEYVKYNKLRRPQFQIRTAICLDTETGRRFVEKEAVRACGQEHIAAFPRRCQAINDCFQNVEALKPEMEKGMMRYAYLEGRNFDDVLSERLQKEADPAAAVAGAIELIFAVKPGGLVPFLVSPEFIDVFGRDAADQIGKILDSPMAFTVSNIDMIFENIMVTGEEGCKDGCYPESDGSGTADRTGRGMEKLYCLDYEWVLDFPVPAQFIRYRNLHYFYRKFGSFLSAYCPRREFLERLGINREQAELFAGMEVSFQEYVHGKKEEYAYTKRYEKEVKTFRELMEDQERSRQQFEHQIEDYKLAVKLKENHIQNLNVMIADRDAMLEKYAPFKKAAKMMGGKAVYKGLKSLYKEASAAGNTMFPEGTDRRRLLNSSKNVLMHPEKSGKLLAAKKGRLFAGDEELDRLYYELGGLEFPVYRKPKVSVIIPVYNQVGYTYRCLASILENTKDVPYEVILADDLSTDGTKALPVYCKGITIVRNTVNLGFLKNCNHAAEHVRGTYIFFLNNDTQVKPGWLSSLVTLMESDPSIGMVGSKLVYPDGRLQEAGGIFWREGNGWNYGKFDDPDKPEYNYVKDVDYISGAAIMLSKKLWQRLGGFDERFAPAYCEDADLAFAVRKAGYRVVYQPLSVVVHYEGISNGTDTGSGIKAYQVANLEKLKEKWAEEFAKQEIHGERPNPFGARERLGNRKVILAIDHYVPTFDKDAGSKSTFQYLELFLHKGYVVKFIGDNYGHEEPYTTVFQQMGIEVLYGRWYEENILSWIEENQKYIQFAYINRPHIAIKYMDFIRKKTDIKIMYYGHDLHFLRELREYDVTGDPAHKKESEYMKKQELALIRTADMSYYPSCVERDVLREIDGSLRVKAVCLNMFESFRENIDFDFAKRKGLMFVGGFAHHPNKDAVMWFVEEIWPLIRRRTDIPFYIVGSKAPEEILALDGQNGIVVKGFVTDEELEELYGSCQAVVVPLRFGAGVKGKVIEALYYGLPTVTTSIGAEGIEGADEVLAVADTAEDFARMTLKYCEDPELSGRTGRAAVEYVKNTFGMEAVWEIVKEDFQ